MLLALSDAVVQAFEIYLPQSVRNEYDKIFATENEQESAKCVLRRAAAGQAMVGFTRGVQARAQYRQDSDEE